jgi:hypothetical protein
MKKFRLAAITAASLAAAGSASALTPAQIESARSGGTLKEVRIAGASALRLSVAAYMKEICNAADFHVKWNSNAEGTNHRAYSCTLALQQGNWVAGTPVLVYKRDQGGSGQGVNPIALAADQTHMVVNSTCTIINGGDTPATDAAIPNYICANTETTGIKSDAGISDVEPAILQAPINLPGTAALTTAQLANLDVAPLAQALFGVVVNLNAYRALQEAQGIIPPGGALIDVPADQATWTAATLATIPSLPTTFVRSMLTTGGLLGGTANATAKRGWNLVIPNVPYSLDGGATLRPAVDANSVNKTLNVCRRTEGSGTQATSNAFFTTQPCNNSAASFLTPLNVPNSNGNESTTRAVAAGTALVVQEGTSAGQVENCVGVDAQSPLPGTGAGTDIAYAIGFLGREANPLRAGSDRLYRYVKLDGIAPVRAQAQAGNYPIVFEATMQWNRTVVAPGSEKDAFLRAIRVGFGTPNALAAVDSDTQQGVMSPPASYSGPWVDLTGNARLFGSRVARVSGNSCGALRIVK